MSRGRLSDCSGSTTGKMDVRVLTHSQAVGSACERRESIACARGLSTPSALSRRGFGEKKKIPLALALAASSDSSSTRSEQKRFTGCVMTKECPCSPREATLGASPRRRAVAGRGFFHPPAATEADGGGARRGGARRVGEGTNLCFSFAFSFRVRDVRFAFATLAFARHLLERGEGKAETVRRARGTVSTTARNAKKQKKQTRAAFIAVRTETNHRLRNDQGMPVFTPGSNPRRLPAAACRRGSCEFIDHPTKNSLARAAAVRSGTAKKNCRCSFRGSSASRTSRPRRGTSRTCGPLSKRAPIAGVLRPLSQVTFCERAANETHIICVSAFPRSSSFAAGFGLKKKNQKTAKSPTSRAPRLSHPVLVTVFFSRKMVNILNVDRHRQSVAWIKLCIIENVVRVFRAFGSGGGGRVGTSRAAVIALRGASRAFGRIRLCIRRWATPDNRRFRPSLSARKVQPSESRSAGIKRPRICTHSCLGGNGEKKKSRETEPPTFSPRPTLREAVRWYAQLASWPHERFAR